LEYILNPFYTYTLYTPYTDYCRQLELQESAKHNGHFALFNCLVLALLGHTKYKGVQRVCAAGLLHSVSEQNVLREVTAWIPSLFGRRALPVWYARVLLLFSASAMTLDPCPSIVPSFQPWKHLMILKMVIIRIIHITAVMCNYTCYGNYAHYAYHSHYYNYI
jgi:hypothetical protein